MQATVQKSPFSRGLEEAQAPGGSLRGSRAARPLGRVPSQRHRVIGAQRTAKSFRTPCGWGFSSVVGFAADQQKCLLVSAGVTEKRL